MKDFLFQTAIQLPIIALIWVLIARDATKLRDHKGSSPAGISPFAWGALCGLTFIVVIPYFLLRRRVAAKAVPIARERNLMTLWIGLTVAGGVWAGSELAHRDVNNAAQHFLLTVILLGCAIFAWYRDHKTSS